MERRGTKVGYHSDGSGGAGYPDGFKLKSGKFTRIPYPNSLLTVPYAIDLNGAIVGFNWDSPAANMGSFGRTEFTKSWIIPTPHATATRPKVQALSVI